MWEHAAQGEEMEFWEAEPLLGQEVVLPRQRFVVVRVWGFCAGEQILPLPHRLDGGNGLAHLAAAV